MRCTFYGACHGQRARVRAGPSILRALHRSEHDADTWWQARLELTRRSGGSKRERELARISAQHSGALSMMSPVARSGEANIRNIALEVR
jgi:hypothetical protein